MTWPILSCLSLRSERLKQAPASSGVKQSLDGGLHGHVPTPLARPRILGRVPWPVTSCRRSPSEARHGGPNQHRGIHGPRRGRPSDVHHCCVRRTSPGPPARRCSVTSHTAPRRKAAQVSPRPPSGPPKWSPKGTVPRHLPYHARRRVIAPVSLSETAGSPSTIASQRVTSQIGGRR
jgi:hypothetical protein